MPVIYADTPVALETVPPSANIRVFRDAEEDIGYRECLVFIDDIHVGEVMPRRNLEFEVEPGWHTIHATNRVRKTQRIRFQAKAGERVTFQVGNTGGAFYDFFSWMQVAIPNIFLKREEAELLQENGYTGLPECWRLG